MRWLLPFSERWSYGDAVFIIDPWIWLLLGAALLLSSEWSKQARIRWGVLAILATAAVTATGAVPVPAKLIWIAGIGTLAGLQRARLRLDTSGVRALGLAAAVYVVLLVLIDPIETRIVRRQAERSGVTGIIDVMVAPAPANPFGSTFIIATENHYRFGSFRWLPAPAIRLDPAKVRVGRSSATDRAAHVGPMHDYLVWSRYPFFTVEQSVEGQVVRAGDLRYARERSAGSLAGITVVVSGGD
jgi:inner membrane protein